MGKQRQENERTCREHAVAHSNKRYNTDFSLQRSRCKQHFQKMPVASWRFKASNSRNRGISHRNQNSRPNQHQHQHQINHRREREHQHQPTIRRSNQNARSRSRLYSSSNPPVIQIRRPQIDSKTNSKAKRSDHERKDGHHRPNLNSNSRLVGRYFKERDSKHLNSNSNSNFRNSRNHRVQRENPAGRQNSTKTGSIPSIPPRPAAPYTLTPSTPSPEFKTGSKRSAKNDDRRTHKNPGDSESKKSDTSTKKYSDSSSSSRSSKSKGTQEYPNPTEFTSYKWITNVLDIPEIYRINFGFPDDRQIGSCPIALKFWYDEKYSDHFKYFIRLYDDSGEWISKKYILKEQVGLALPQTYELNILEILEIITNCPFGKRVWLDIRDFDLFSERKSGLLQPILSSVTHFTFGGRLSRFSSPMLHAYGDVVGAALLYYLLNNVENLEYLCLDDEMLWKLNSDILPPAILDKSLKNLHTLRLLSSCESNYVSTKLKIKMTGCYVLRILRLAPNIRRLYGISTTILKDIEIENGKSYPYPQVHLDGLIRSLSLKPEPSPETKETYDAYFLQSLSILHEGRPPTWHHLEELDTRTFFHIKSHVQVQCIDVMSKIIQLNKDTIKKVIIKPIRVQFSHLKFPPLPNCTTIHFEILRNYCNVGSYFSPGIRFNQIFPNLDSVEIWSSGLDLDTVLSQKAVNEQTLFNRHFSEWAFEARLSLKRVKNLTLFRYCSTSTIHSMAYLFQNVTVLQLDNTLTEVAHFLPYCFEEWPKLKQLVLKINTDTRNGDLDAALTGIKRDKLKILSEPPFSDLLYKVDFTDVETSERVQDIIDTYRTQLSICHLQDLHLLKLILRSGAMHQTRALTKLSVVYGFGRGRMPNLAVQIGFHHRVTTDDKNRMIAALAPVLPYVSLER